MDCQNNQHNFVVAEKYDGGVVYRCDRCGLLIDVPPVPEGVFGQYFDSFVDGISLCWDDAMDAEDIVSFAMVYGDLQKCSVQFNGFTLTLRNLMHDADDFRKSFAVSYFDKREFLLTEGERNQLKEQLSALDFPAHALTEERFAQKGIPSFFNRERFFCRFSDGRGFQCLLPETEDFTALITLVKEIAAADHSSDLDFARHDSVVSGVVCAECKNEFPDFALYCPFCGKKVNDGDERRDVLYDKESTLWICKHCGGGNSYAFDYCTNCGKKR